MPRGFNAQEKQLIRTRLMERGRELFSTLGLKKTSIEDLTRSVGIAQGSFYNFFTSKEELYFEILEGEEEGIKAVLLKESGLPGGSPKDRLKRFLTRMFGLIDDSIFIKKMYGDQELEMLARALPADKFTQHRSQDSSLLVPLIQKWQEEGVIAERDPEAVAGLIRSVIMISFHKDQIGDAYASSMELLIEFMAEGLAGKGDTK